MQTVHILQLDSADTDSLPKGGFLQDNPNLLPNKKNSQRFTTATYFVPALTLKISSAFSKVTPTHVHCTDMNYGSKMKYV